MAKEASLLSPDQLEQFHQDGYLVVPNVLKNHESFCQETLQPFLEKHEQYFTSTIMATGEYDSNIHTEVPGLMLRNLTDHSDPLPNDGQAWVLQNEQLLGILNQLHSNENISSSAEEDKDSGPNWEWLQPTNIGWIHVRLPVSNASQFEHRWHVDGGFFSPHYLLSPEQSVVVLPMLHDVGVGGGNTVVLPGSHHYMAQLLHQNREQGLSKAVTQDLGKLGRAWTTRKEIAPCHGGDVLILHPLLVHAAGFHTNGAMAKRITFNLGTKWTRSLSLEEPTSWLESSLKRSLSETVGLPKLSVEAPFQLMES